MTVATDRLVATTKLETKPEPKSGNCWVLTDRYGAGLDDHGSIVHHDSEKDATNWAVTHDAEGYRPRQLDKPCVVVTCICCGCVFDEEEDATVHFDDIDEVKAALPQYGWKAAADDTWTCEPCASRCDCEPKERA